MEKQVIAVSTLWLRGRAWRSERKCPNPAIDALHKSPVAFKRERKSKISAKDALIKNEAVSKVERNELVFAKDTQQEEKAWERIPENNEKDAHWRSGKDPHAALGRPKNPARKLLDKSGGGK